MHGAAIAGVWRIAAGIILRECGPAEGSAPVQLLYAAAGAKRRIAADIAISDGQVAGVENTATVTGEAGHAIAENIRVFEDQITAVEDATAAFAGRVRGGFVAGHERVDQRQAVRRRTRASGVVNAATVAVLRITRGGKAVRHDQVTQDNVATITDGGWVGLNDENSIAVAATYRNAVYIWIIVAITAQQCSQSVHDRSEQPATLGCIHGAVDDNIVLNSKRGCQDDDFALARQIHFKVDYVAVGIAQRPVVTACILAIGTIRKRNGLAQRALTVVDLVVGGGGYREGGRVGCGSKHSRPNQARENSVRDERAKEGA
ncbi:MAG: hypothetical protein RJQ08_14010 [Salinisphaeraceae bacterium]